MKIELEEMIWFAQSVAMNTWGPRQPSKLLDKLIEEVDELRGALLQFNMVSNGANNKLELLKEFGDTLFCLIRFADQLDIDLGEALSLTIVKVQERIKFDLIEEE